ncbi:MAG: PadR family transcriptional regulator [Marinifilaceae bacterium]|jgi:PadR family transcriptional regulator PadR
MKEENIKSQMRKGVLEYCILLLLNSKDGYASDLIRKLKDSQMIVVEGTLYPLLTRMKNAEYLSYRWEESTQGPPRKYYNLTDKGRKFLSDLEDSWDLLNQAVNKLKNK